MRHLKLTAALRRWESGYNTRDKVTGDLFDRLKAGGKAREQVISALEARFVDSGDDLSEEDQARENRAWSDWISGQDLLRDGDPVEGARRTLSGAAGLV